MSARRTKWMRRARRVGAPLLGVLAFLTLAGGFLHTAAGRPLMARIFGASCPMKSATADSVDRARRMGVATQRGTVLAPARAAFQFRLDRTTVAEIRAWAKQRGVSCDEEHAWLIKCSNVAPATLGRPDVEGTIEELALGFRPDGRLVNVSTLRRHLTPEQGNRVATHIAAVLDEQLGQNLPASDHTREGNLSAEPLSSIRVSFHYRDYLADVVAMNLPTTGVIVREHYVSAED